MGYDQSASRVCTGIGLRRHIVSIDLYGHYGQYDRSDLYGQYSEYVYQWKPIIHASLRRGTYGQSFELDGS
jgi:hypothetical protein